MCINKMTCGSIIHITVKGRSALLLDLRSAYLLSVIANMETRMI